MAKFILSERQFSTIKNKLNEIQDTVEKTFDVSNIFSSGKYVIEDKEQIDNVLNEINQFAQRYKNFSIIVTIIASESKVPNQSAGFEKGELSKNRLQQVNNYIKDKLPKNVTIEYNDRGPIGPEWDPSLGKDHADYSNVQRVMLNVRIITKKFTPQLNRENNPKFCGQQINGKGNYGDPNNFFISEQKTIEIGSGEGIVFLSTIPYDYPDLFIIEYNNKTYTTGLIGNNSLYNRLIIGTILAHKRLDNPWFEAFEYNEYNINSAKKIAIQMLRTNSKAVDDVRHVFNEDMGPELFDKVKPYMLSSDTIINSNNYVMKINKVDGVDSLKLTVIGIIGGTQWKMTFGCGRNV